MFFIVSKCLQSAHHYTSSKEHSSVLYIPNKLQYKRQHSSLCFSFRQQQLEIAAAFRHPCISVCSTSVKEGQCCLSHIWETEEQRLSILESMRERRERNQRALTPPCLCWSHWGTPGNCCIFDLSGQNLFAVGSICFLQGKGLGTP